MPENNRHRYSSRTWFPQEVGTRSLWSKHSDLTGLTMHRSRTNMWTTLRKSWDRSSPQHLLRAREMRYKLFQTHSLSLKISVYVGGSSTNTMLVTLSWKRFREREPSTIGKIPRPSWSIRKSYVHSCKREKRDPRMAHFCATTIGSRPQRYRTL